MIKLTINHEGEKITGEIPSKFEELSVKQFLALEGKENDIQILSVLSGLDVSFLENTNTDLTPTLEKIYFLLNNKPPDLMKAPKKDIVLEGKKIRFPKTLDFTRYGQKSMVKNLILEEEKVERIIAEVFAVYAQPLIDGKFDSSRIPALKLHIEKMPIISVFPYAVFFFKKLNELKNTLPVNLAQFLKPQVNAKTTE